MALEPAADRPPAAAFEQPVTEPWERLLTETPSWPVTRLASWSLSLCLAATVFLPAAIGQLRGTEPLLLVAPGLLATIAARALFETIGFAAGRRALPRHAASAMPPALLAGVVMAGAAAIVRPPWSPVIGLITAGLSFLVLATAGAMRSVEIRRWRRLRRVYFVGSQNCFRDIERELAQRRDRELVGGTTISPAAAEIDQALFAADALTRQPTMLVLDSTAIRVTGLPDDGSKLGLPGVGVCDLTSYYEQEFKKVPLSEPSSDWQTVDASPVPRRRAYVALRRVLEVGVATLLLTVAVPVVLVAAAAIRITSRGPALFRQRRVGKDGVPFTLVKLRTMTDDEGGEAAWASTHAHRVTSVGRHLRRFRIDELPQLWNVVRGDLALIGPRPEQVAIVEQLDRLLPRYQERHRIRPGITGWAQVSLGYGGSLGGSRAKLQCDLYYVKHASLRLDALIVWLTLKAVLAGRG